MVACNLILHKCSSTLRWIYKTLYWYIKLTLHHCAQVKHALNFSIILPCIKETRSLQGLFGRQGDVQFLKETNLTQRASVKYGYADPLLFLTFPLPSGSPPFLLFVHWLCSACSWFLFLKPLLSLLILTWNQRWGWLIRKVYRAWLFKPYDGRHYDHQIFQLLSFFPVFLSFRLVPSD